MTGIERDAVVRSILILEPSFRSVFDEEALDIYITLAGNIVDAIDPKLNEKKRVSAIAFLTLDMLSIQDMSNVSSKKIVGVAETYNNKNATSKWRKLYDTLLNDYMTGDMTLNYTGI